MLSRDNISDIYPLTPLQEGILFHDLIEQDGAGSRAYFQQLILRIRGPLDLDAFRASWTRLIARHDILRTVFKPTGADRPLQIVLKTRDFALDIRDLRALPPAEREAAEQRYIAADRATPFDLTRDLLMRVGCLIRGDRDHLVVWSFHHILMDGWCIGILQDELVATYAALTAGSEPPRTPTVPFSRFVKWLETRDRKRALAFWEGYLAGYETRLALPGQRPAPPAGPRRHRVHTVAFGPSLSAGLRALAQRHAVTLGTVIEALWAVLLAKTNDCRDVVFGAVVSIRPADLPGAERMLGLCINTLPVRATFGPADTVADLLRRLGDDRLPRIEHAHMPLAEIQSRRGARNTLFDHFLAFENYPKDRRFSGRGEVPVPGVVIDQVDAFMPNSYDVSVTVFPETDITLAVEFNETVVAPEAVAVLGDRLLRLAGSFAAAPERTIDSLSLLSEAERRTILDVWSRGAAAAAPARSVPEQRARLLARHGERPALRSAGGSLSHRALQDRAAALAGHLAGAFGVTAGGSVAVVATPGEGMITAMLACLLLGTAFVPIDPAAPAARTAHILADCGASLLLTERDAPLPEGVAGRPRLVLDAALFDRLPADPGPAVAAALPPVPEDAPAYIIYTSGTTGLPKGVRVGQHSLLNYAVWLGSAFGVDHTARTALLTSPAFDLGYTAVFGALLLGGCLTLLSEAERRDPQQVIDTIVEHDLTFLKLTPSYLHLLLTAPGAEHLAAAASLDLMVIGGEEQQFADLRRLRSLRPGLRLVNHYGPTEATIGCIAGAMDDALLDQPAPPQRIGRPVAGARILLCDDALVPVPPGVPGELLVGGVPLAQGYVNPSPKDAARFTVLPWLDGERFYRTGDYALWLPDGSLAFLGRRDDQVKIRGYRVVLRSVEAALRALPEIRDAVLVADRQAQGGGDLVAYVIPQDGAELSPKGLRAGLGAVLPEPMIPSQFIPVSRFPLTANGKIDRTALAAHRRPRRGTDAGERGSAVEETLRQIWQSVLFQESIGLDDDFFELGGHSIKAILILSKVRSTLKQRLAIRDLFDNPTIRRLARRLAEPAESGAEPPPSPLLTLRTGSPSAIPAFFLPPTLGTATPYKEVVDRLSGDLACYGLQCRGFDCDEPPDRDFAAMAAGFAKRIRAALPAGPYRLVGWSMGAYLALETARLLERDGAAVRLVLLDAAPKLGDGRDDPAPPPIDGFATLRREPYWNRVLDIMTRHLPPSDLARIERLAVHNHHLTVAYSFTGQLQADIACIEGAANQRPARMERLVAATSGRVTVHHVPGNHYTMFQPPNLEVVATFLSAALAAP